MRQRFVPDLKRIAGYAEVYKSGVVVAPNYYYFTTCPTYFYFLLYYFTIDYSTPPITHYNCSLTYYYSLTLLLTMTTY